ncbi:lysine biosynthesis protein LysW [Meiothermus granaticius]|uniref:Alpha-aminoadipate carrier protein LysW n=1 Tax=Meiothermus granaticius NBRC 107808 TaxID=1227551 RepID=A0A399FEW2_9DEIN|nr:lysine biosynthesis protein LysW [Meiothermus granaticius]MCL6528270.1 lysine biosynthesis protein LysW [Thermaceae bacterium]RIH93581.1 Alpha-aminoadipate carrier protein LysW [Meiothermus granaticius NBRC 107808]GEM87219.1 alpha-aminoadipate carrier protein LysW [Meiothermus granaticius NBRC 107808]
MAKIAFENPETGATIELENPELGELVVDDETGQEFEVISLDPPKLAAAPEEAEDWGE